CRPWARVVTAGSSCRRQATLKVFCPLWLVRLRIIHDYVKAADAVRPDNVVRFERYANNAQEYNKKLYLSMV
ncbi:hypothetical protein K3H44_20395, partial [Aeromonas veronii]|uniref:hypothetical protein n=1 Tax=Aeromonas veronii TaxID=654 RepID=UPI001F207073